MKLLLLGADGQVGWELQRSLAPLGEVLSADLTGSYRRIDLTDFGGLTSLVDDFRPNWIVNAAAYTAVDKAEAEEGLAREINATAPGVLASAARKVDAKLVHFSTDYVFDGSGSDYRDEAAETGPLSVYGKTKLEGEHAIAAVLPHHLILRTSWVYAVRGHNFIRTILRLAEERDQLTVINDQIGAPTSAELLADVAAHCIAMLEAGRGDWGKFHCVAAGETSWFGLAKYVIERAIDSGVSQALSQDKLRAISTSDYPTAARRPLNSRLSTLRLQSTFRLRLPHWQAGVDRMLKEVGVVS